MTEEVEYRFIGGTDYYRVSSVGVVESCLELIPDELGRLAWAKSDKWKPLKPYSDKDGYLIVSLRINGRSIKKTINVILLESFVGPRPSSKHQSCHNDGDCTNNTKCNLRWDTVSANAKDRLRHGTSQIGSIGYSAKLSDDEVREMRYKRKEGDSLQSLSLAFGVSVGTVSRICSGKRREHVV